MDAIANAPTLAREPRKGSRLDAIDAARGMAVLAMIAWHSADAWLGGGAREGAAFALARELGGLAAPAFFLLAGAALGLGAPARPELRHTLLSIARGARLVLAGYGLALFSWAVDHGALRDPGKGAPLALGALSLVTLALALEPRPRGTASRLALGVVGLGAATLAGALLDEADARVLARLDVLHGIGAALALTAALLHSLPLAPRKRAGALTTGALLVAALSASTGLAAQRALPESLLGWVARSAGTQGGFPLSPWLAYTLLGAALAQRARGLGALPGEPFALPGLSARLARRPLLLALGAALVALAAWATPGVVSPGADPTQALRGVSRLVRNASALLVAAALLAGLAPHAHGLAQALARLGRRSLLVYAVHLELVYGLMGLPLRGALDAWTWPLAAALVVLSASGLARLLEDGARVRRDPHPARVHALA
jgi:uncharacterized membrane protein